MEAKALTAVDLFGGRVCYEIPPFQRSGTFEEHKAEVMPTISGAG